MTIQLAAGILIPLVGTALGSACVFFLGKMFSPLVQKTLLGFAGGVMVAASVWSLLIPAMEQMAGNGKLAVIPAALGFLLGIFFLLLLDKLVPHLHVDTGESEGPRSNLKKTTKMLFAVTLHNIPEGMAVGVLYAGVISGEGGITSGAALALSLGIAIQNFPEGVIVSMPLKAEGMKKGKAFIAGLFSGAVEPVFALITVFATGVITIALPYLLSFAAGAMIYVVIEELVPEMSRGKHSNIGVVFFALGFVLMMVLDVALGCE